jgi:hypothetical protein
LVDQRGLAVVDVGDDRHVAKIIPDEHQARVRPPRPIRF